MIITLKNEFGCPHSRKAVENGHGHFYVISVNYICIGVRLLWVSVLCHASPVNIFSRTTGSTFTKIEM